MPNKSISQIINETSGDTLDRESNILKIKIECSIPPSFIMGYCAAQREIFEEACFYLKKQIAPNASTLEVNLDPHQRNLVGYFLENKEKMQKLEGEIILVKVKGFERLNTLGTWKFGTSFRIAHDYDQDVCESEKKKFAGLTKKVLVITQIDPFIGEQGYATALRSAFISQFKSFLYEFKNNEL